MEREPGMKLSEMQETKPGASLVGALALFVAVRCAVPWMPALPRGVNEVVAIGLYVWLVVALVLWLVRNPIVKELRALVLLASGLAWVALLLAIKKEPAVEILLRSVQDACLVAFMATAALLVVPLLKETSILVPIVGAAAVADVIYILVAPMQTILSKAPDVVTKVAAYVPAFGEGLDKAAGPKGFWIGPGDVLLIAFMFAACARFQLRSRRTFWATGAIVWVALLIVALTGWPLPGWLFLATAFLVANAGAITLTPEERRITYGALVAGVLLVIGAAWAVATRGG